jgi:hypothetical protein
MKVGGGQRWEVTRDLATGGITMWRAPFTGGFNCTLPAGTVLRVENDPVPGARAVYCLPEDYEGLEQLVVPEADRRGDKYDGYALVVLLEEFGQTLMRL